MAYKARNTVTSAAKTTTGNSGALTLDPGATLQVFLDVTAVSGTTPTLDVTVEWSHDGASFFPAQPPDSFTQVTAVSKAVKNIPVKAPFYRVVWTIGGTTPSFTFAINEYVTG